MAEHAWGTGPNAPEPVPGWAPGERATAIPAAKKGRPGEDGRDVTSPCSRHDQQRQEHEGQWSDHEDQCHETNHGHGEGRQ